MTSCLCCGRKHDEEDKLKLQIKMYEEAMKLAIQQLDLLNNRIPAIKASSLLQKAIQNG